jgi:hypothetical protein
VFELGESLTDCRMFNHTYKPESASWILVYRKEKELISKELDGSNLLTINSRVLLIIGTWFVEELLANLDRNKRIHEMTQSIYVFFVLNVVGLEVECS